MIKTILATLVLLASTAAFAEIEDTTDYNCWDLQHHINRNGVVSMYVDGSKYYTRFIAAPGFGGSCSDDDEHMHQDFYPTADFKNCSLYTCEEH